MNARSKKGWYGEVKIIARRPFYYLAALKWMLETGNYHTSEYESFIKNDGKKERELYKLPFFPDRHKVTSGKMMSYHDYCCINSYNGWLKHCDSIRLKRKYIEPLIPYCEIFYIECIKGGGINNENVSEYKKCG